MKIKPLLYKYLFSEAVPVEGRILNLVFLFGICGALVTTIVNLIEGAGIFSVLFTLGMAVAALFLVIISNKLYSDKFNAYKITAWIAVIVICDILMPLMFFASAGIESGMPGYFVMCMVLIFLVMDGRECVIMVIINMALTAACYYVQHRFPRFVIPFSFELHREINHVQTIYIAGLLIGFIIKYQISIYKAEKKKAEDAVKAKSDFLANVSHELRTPLNAVIGLGELELRKEHKNDTTVNLEKIQDSGKVLLSIINDLLDLSKIESGKFDLIPVEYNVASLINDTVSLNIVRIGSKPINFHLKVDPEIPTILFGDELRIRQILNNLLSNAFKYTKEGSVDLVITGEKSENSLTLVCAVTDTGIGIRQEDAGKLFGVYNQVDTRSNRHIEGTGLGLSICKNLTEMMGGVISVQSEYGKGSAFTVRIPQKIGNPAPVGEENARNLEKFRYNTIKRDRRRSSRLQLPYARVLVVDDVSTNLDVAKGMMLPYGMDIDCVTSGHEAVQLIQDNKTHYDAIFMDHMMPDMNGIEAVRIIRNEIGTGYAKAIPIIALTANAIVGTDELFLKNGFQAFLSKPIDSIKLDKLLHTWVRNKDKEAAILPSAVPAGVKNIQEDSVSFSFTHPVDGMDFTEGLGRFLNNEKTYLRILKAFVLGMPPYMNKVQAFTEDQSELEKSLNDYIITVHGIKGSSYGVAANTAGKKAEELEQAAKRGDLDWVMAHNWELVNVMNKLLADLTNMAERGYH
ncbi:MAG: response regulator [Treponema sp.]|jgi:signal transduction histidine kinase/CheY-like chemotaxis protein/HPt (histidine-containing phosphotransfer) domain-containing protein|nr:response regulator [Treponema sp.]